MPKATRVSLFRETPFRKGYVAGDIFLWGEAAALPPEVPSLRYWVGFHNVCLLFQLMSPIPCGNSS